MIVYDKAYSSDLNRILELQNLYHKSSVDERYKAEQGFVTVRHDLNLLEKMNHPFPHSVCRDNDLLVAYALTMIPDLREEIEILKPLFKMMDTELEKKKWNVNYVVMGQICIDEGYRGRGIFYGLYNYMQKALADHYTLCVTEVSSHNPRSLKAHYNQGFELLKRHTDDKGEEWHLIYWKW